ncbi:uncharacterized protein IL334_000658 [Kwoniella shivajii]|uniref:TPR-like protein n=1 Tax=Kwoniella shivajii TaxID=564305 RepID=A0ABZ1CQ34_9TREE|nr:hypothetical protein IL334_000658 [Kwoniella shivajii]
MSALATSVGSTPKAAHYNTSLTAALLRGAWAESTPGQAPNKTDLSWGELVRKWGKHTGGNTSLIHYLRDISLLYLSSTSHATTSSSGFITVPPSSSQPTTGGEQGPVSSNSSNDSNGGSHSSFVHIPHPHLRHRKKNSLDEVASASGSTIRANEGGVGVSSKASYLSSGDLDGDEVDDYRGWGEGNEWWNGVGSEGLEEVKEGIKSLEGLIQSGKLSAAELTSARLTLAYHLHALGSHEDALSVYGSVDWTAENRFGIVQGDAAVLERIRGRYLQGLSYELSPIPDYTRAIQSYLLTIPLLQSLSSFHLPIPSYFCTQPTSQLPFDPYREIFRYLSTALTRAAVLSARQSTPTAEERQMTLRILRTYHSFNSSWPASFRPVQRQRMLVLYLRTLEATYPAPRQPPPETPLLYPGSCSLSARSLWTKEVTEAVRQGRSLLQATTSFPRAGSLNRPVTTFTELSVALYSRSAELGREIISVLWWAMTLTFQSQTILRHLTHLLSDVGDSVDARRVFELYIQLVLKARETQQPESSVQLRSSIANDDSASPDEAQQEAENADPDNIMKKGSTPESEIDTDRQFIETLLGGTRLLSRDLGETEEAWRYATLAGDVISNGGIGVGNVLRARIEEAKGIVRMGMAVHTADAVDRPTYQAQAINHLTAAIDLSPTASGYYHLAHCQAEARSIDAATQSIRSSLELDPSNVQAWHLLALLLTARRDWEGAMKACDAGVSVWEQDEESSAGEEELPGNDSGNTVESRDFAIIPPTPMDSPTELHPLILKDGSFPHLSISPPRTTPLSRSAKLEHVMRLRMTLNVIIEKQQGPELAMLKQQELFAFFSARSGKNRGKLGYSSGFGKGGGMKSVASGSSINAMTTATGNEDGKEGLGGSYISVGVTEGVVAVQSPTPTHVNPPVNAISLAPPVSEKPPINIQTPSTSSRPSSPKLVVPNADDIEDESARRSSSIRSKATTAKHLHVPGTGNPATSGISGTGTAVSRPSSVRRLNVTPQYSRERAGSASHSIAPTAIHSHFHNYTPSSRTLQPPPPPLNPSEDHGRTSAESRILSNLWLMSAATFRRWGKLEQCLVAIEEAEVLDPENADVWVQLGLYHSTINQHQTQSQHNASDKNNSTNLGIGGGLGDNSSEASFVKSLLLKPEHPPAIIGLSKLYFQTNQIDLAESLLNQLTQESGWDIVEGWFWLGKISQVQGRSKRANECWQFALGLENSRAVRSWNEVGRWL